MRKGLEDGRGQSDTVPIHGAAPLRCFDKTVNTMKYALHIYLSVFSFWVGFLCYTYFLLRLQQYMSALSKIQFPLKSESIHIDKLT